MNSLKERYLAAKRRLFDRAYGEKLNPEQRAAVFTAKGPLLVLAGAGSGKTTVLVNRIVYLIKYGNAYADETLPEDADESAVSALEEACELTPEEIRDILPQFISEPCPPWAMLAITFTNKAAGEIRERLDRAFGDAEVTNAVWAGTFHSVCLRILRKYGERLGYRSGFSVYDTDDKKRLITDCMKELGIDDKILPPKSAAALISAAKDKLQSPADMEIPEDYKSTVVRRLYECYQKRLMKNNAVDFDDIIMKTVELLEQDSEVLAYYQNKFRYVSVDEYQDTNYAQFVLTELLSGKYRNIMVVGDDDQSIYRFRGATVENILNFDKTYPDAKVIKLEQNYRSTETILDAANAVISHNGMRHDKHLWSDKGAGEKIRLHESENQIEEGRFIVDEIALGVAGGKHTYKDYAVLYRINEMARSLESTFSKRGIPYRIIGAQRFTDKKEIRDMIAYLYLVSSPDDDQRLKRVINEPKRKIGASTVEAVENIGRVMGLPMYTVLSRAGEFPEIAKNAQKLQTFVSLIDGLRAENLSPSALIPEVFERSGYHDMLLKEGFEGEGRIDSVNEFVSAAAEYENRCRSVGEEPTLDGFLEEVALVSDVDRYDEDANAVVLMTVHSAKGLEFPVVFLAGMEDGIFPSETNLTDPAAMSEERRLAYVAITRAKEALYITYAKSRMLYGRERPSTLSVFVRDEVPEGLMSRDRPRRVPPPSRPSPYGGYERPVRGKSPFSDGFDKPKTGAARYGVEHLPVGSRVSHTIFGDGTVTSAKDIGGDVLYEVAFDSGQTKRLMASFAKLRRI